MSNKEAKDFINLGVVVNDKNEILMIRRVKKIWKRRSGFRMGFSRRQADIK